MLVLTPALLQAQIPRWSIGGTLFGVTYETESKQLDLGLPGGGPLGAPAVNVGFYPHPNVIVLPAVAFGYAKPDTLDSSYHLALDLQIEWHLKGVSASSFYVGLDGVFAGTDPGTGSSTTDFAAGGAAGYRYLMYDFFAFRFEGVYRRWFDKELNEISGVIKAEVVFN
jgi:hypothetical protein